MPPKVKAVRTRSQAQPAADPRKLPAPFKTPPEVLQPFIDLLSPKHVYITHVDLKPVDFKRKIFLVPISMNVVIAALFGLRMYWILPWYWNLITASFGQQNDLTFNPAGATWGGDCMGGCQTRCDAHV